MPSATIKIYLPHGDPKRLRTGEISNWSGKAVAGPRTELDQLLKREEAENVGVYLLTGVDPKSGGPAVYIGEAESIQSRLKQHVEKDFWNHVTYFTSKDENLTKSHIRYLEGRLIELAKLAGRASLTNSQASSSKLPESDRADMEIFLEKIEQLLPALGVEVLVPIASGAESKEEARLLLCEVSGLKATGHLTPNGIVVFAQSQAAGKLRPSAKDYPWVVNAREQLIKDGVLIPADGHLTFAKNHEFTSPSAAAAVIHGGTANGRTAWKDTSGKTLKQLESAD
ncbi:GIY-YIG nuclease family protein [Halopseudomonas sp.]|uniref:GIY-YIG nuclease family protein n=1 Tax=Halopseudomonas sp. TaxID=2901191 RepID=UPI003002D9FD